MGKNKKSNFDGIVSFDMPVHIKNDNEEEISIYGLLFNKKERHDDDLWSWELNRYMCATYKGRKGFRKMEAISLRKCFTRHQAE